MAGFSRRLQQAVRPFVSASGLFATTAPLMNDSDSTQRADIPNGRTNANSVASTAWYLLATQYPWAIWAERR